MNASVQTPSATAAAADRSTLGSAAGARGVVQHKAHLRNLQFFDQQAAALTPRESLQNDRGAGDPVAPSAPAEDFAALLAAAAAAPKTRCDDVFIAALKAKSGALKADECDLLVGVFRAVTASQRAQLVEAIGAAPMGVTKAQRDLGNAPVNVEKYEKDHAGERVVTKSAEGLLRGKIIVEISFSPLEREAIFEELLKLPPGARKNQEVLRAFVPSPNTLSFYTYNSADMDQEGTKEKAKVESRKISITTADSYVKEGAATPDAASKRAIIARATRHEVGHAFDYKKHPGPVTGAGWHENQGWKSYPASFGGLTQALSQANGLWHGPTKTSDAHKAAGEAVLTKAIDAGGTPNLQTAVADAIAVESTPKDFATWFPATQAYKVFTAAPDIKKQWKERHKINGGLFHYFSVPPKGFYLINSSLSAQLLKWDNYRAALTPREWAAECYSAWFEVDRAGDEPGKKPGAQFLTPDALAWVKDPDLHKDDPAPAPGPAPK